MVSIGNRYSKRAYIKQHPKRPDVPIRMAFHAALTTVAGELNEAAGAGGYDVMVACQLPKLNARVRFPLPAPAFAPAELQLASHAQFQRRLPAEALAKVGRSQMGIPRSPRPQVRIRPPAAAATARRRSSAPGRRR